MPKNGLNKKQLCKLNLTWADVSVGNLSHSKMSSSLVPRLSKGGGGKESLVHTVCACVKLCTRLARAMTCYDVLATFDRVLTSALIDF